jgi:hypothetical protein
VIGKKWICHGGSGEAHKKSQIAQLVSWLRLEPGISHIQNRAVTTTSQCLVLELYLKKKTMHFT